MNYAEYIRILRKNARLTQKALAEAVGVATGTIQQYELNKRQPRSEILDKIADVCNAPRPSLLGDGAPIQTFNSGCEFEKAHAKILEESQVADAEEKKRLEQLTTNFYKLNAQGQQIAVERTAELTQLSQYTEGRRISVSIARSPERDTIQDNVTGEKIVIEKDSE